MLIIANPSTQLNMEVCRNAPNTHQNIRNDETIETTRTFQHRTQKCAYFVANFWAN